MVNADSLNPQELYEAIWRTDGNTDQTAYNKLPCINVQLQSLQAAYETSNINKALSYLHRRCNIKIDEEQNCVDVSDPDYCFSADKSFIDYYMVIGKNIGLEMFLPMVPIPNFSVTLNLKVPYKEFRAKYAKLGFNPVDSMLYAGNCLAEDFWIAMAPNEFFSMDSGSTTKVMGANMDTRLSTRHYRIVIAFLACALSKLQERGYYSYGPYDIDLDAAHPYFEDHTNIM